MEAKTVSAPPDRLGALGSGDGRHPDADATAHRLATIVESSEDAIVGVSLDGLVTSWNPAAERLLGYTEEEICGRPLSCTWPEGSFGTFQEAHEKLMRGERIPACESRRVRKDGSIVDVSVTTSPVRDPDGRMVGVASILRDITERREAEAATRLLANVVESSDDAIIAREIDGTVTSWNPGAERLLGYDAAEMVGQHIARVWAPDALASLADMQARLAAGERVPTFETRAIRKDQTVIDVSVTAFPLRDAEGRVTGASAIARDITERRAAEASARLLAGIVESTTDAVVARDLEGTVRSWNPAAERVLGYTAEEMIGSTTAPLWRADRESFEQMQSRLAAGESVAPFEAKAVRGDNTVIEVSVTASPIKDAEGCVTGVAVIFRDITASKKALSELHEARRRFEGAFHNAPIGMALVDPKGAWLEVNEALCGLMGRSEQQLLATDFQSLTHPDDLEPGLEAIRQAVAGNTEGFEMQNRYLRPDGSVVWAALGSSLVHDDDGNPLYFVCQIQDITECKESEKELLRYTEHLTELALQDPLTGLRNYRDFHSMIDTELQRSRRYEREWSVVLLDVDHFSEINALSGHFGGDRVLREVGAALEQARRSSDLAARIGSDEFALVLAETTGDDAERTARRIVAEVAARTDGVSVSYGTASWPADGTSKDLVLVRADKQLQAAKPRRDTPSKGLGGKWASKSDGSTDGIHRILELAREQLGMEVAYVAELTETSQVFRVIAGDPESFGVAEGGALPLESTYCRQMVDGAIPNVISDTASEPDVASLPITGEAGIGSYVGVPLELADGRMYGSLCALSHASTPELAERHVDLMHFLGGLIAEQIEQDEQEVADRQSHAELAGMNALLSALMARDHYTGEHSKSVVAMATQIARRLDLSEECVVEVEQVALLHDVGKVGIPDALLQKREPLNDQEWELMRQHPAIGARILAGTQTLSHLAPAVEAEHERFDGGGYPGGLTGEEIPLPSRIAFACDAYHAMTSDRPYRGALTFEKARAELVAGAGSQFDPTVVEALLAVIDGEPAAEGLGEVRAICRNCGTHLAAVMLRTTLRGSCSNCGGCELDLLDTP